MIKVTLTVAAPDYTMPKKYSFVSKKADLYRYKCIKDMKLKIQVGKVTELNHNLSALNVF